MICRYCGKSLSENASFCGACGRSLKDSAAAAPVTAKPSRHPLSLRTKALLSVTAILLIAAGAFFYHWYNRPEGRYVQDNSGIYRFPQDGKWGYVNKSGHMIIQPQFDEARDFSEKLAAVRIGDKFGYIDTTGKLAVSPQFSDASTFRYGRALVKVCCGTYGQTHPDDHYGYIDSNGKLIGNPQYSDAGSFAGNRFNPLAPVVFEGKLGFIDKSGAFAIPPAFEYGGSLYGFTEGLAPVINKGKWGYIDRSGSWAIEPQYDHASNFTDGLAAVVISGKSGFIDSKGKFVINPQFDSALYFEGGYAPVRNGDQWKIIDRNGNVADSATYKSVWDFLDDDDGMWAVSTDDGWGYVQSGKLIIPPVYDSAGRFLGGLAPVTLGSVNAYIDKKGAFVGDPFKGHTIQPAQPVQEIWEGDETYPKFKVHFQFVLVRQGSKITGYYTPEKPDTSQLNNQIEVAGDVADDGSLQLRADNGLFWKGHFAAPVVILGTMPADPSDPGTPFRIHFVRAATPSELLQPEPRTTSSWPEFLDSFKQAFNSHDENKLAGMMGRNFYLYDADIHNAADVFRQMNWPQLTTAIAEGTVGSQKSPLGHQQRYILQEHPCDQCVYEVELTFEQDDDGQWHWTGVVYPGD